jgi:hypothetical protein
MATAQGATSTAVRPSPERSLSGLIVLVDRGGSCNFTLKISNISQGGGLAGIIGLIAPGAPFSGGDGGDRPIDIPGYMISQADSNAIKAAIGNPVDRRTSSIRPTSFRSSGRWSVQLVPRACTNRQRRS